ncbi:GNAT family N-acetyltransferase [Bacillus suaedaesalsae]|uniref:GNAT family N-acetyltransferase n=1 Tax=Bacillus suaedaesalsae TaxID=2810349 RepID=A0ABS2DDJ7_9BACI|nr:GNAT family N-acetyltransferase [Bacillus suaedaesalsae]MBM6616523.1 GNAT family N-acetyltransferase [Bacillus suaedaesalsae]
MIKDITLGYDQQTKELYEMQKASYLIEAKLINYYEIPPLVETFEQLVKCGEKFMAYLEDEKLLGAISYTVENQELTICRMIVHPHHFRKGIAGTLLLAVEEKAISNKSIKVSTGKDNTPAKNLYIKHNFTLLQDIEVAPGLYISLFGKNLLG